MTVHRSPKKQYRAKRPAKAAVQDDADSIVEKAAVSQLANACSHFAHWQEDALAKRHQPTQIVPESRRTGPNSEFQYGLQLRVTLACVCLVTGV